MLSNKTIVELLIRVYHRFDVVPVARPHTTCRAHVKSAVPVTHECQDSLSQCLGVTRCDQEPCHTVINLLFETPGTRSHDRQTASHGLTHAIAHSFVKGGTDQEIGGAH